VRRVTVQCSGGSQSRKHIQGMQGKEGNQLLRAYKVRILISDMKPEYTYQRSLRRVESQDLLVSVRHVRPPRMTSTRRRWEEHQRADSSTGLNDWDGSSAFEEMSGRQ
jgi:hypothetical protein